VTSDQLIRPTGAAAPAAPARLPFVVYVLATDLTEPARRPTSVPPVDDGRGSGMPAVCAHGNGDRARRQFCERIGLAGLLALRTL